ncbi:hypothetical protein AB0D57_32370 [Streptomyces sp. NPDC048275]|uniref:hypothetical protein n=1 Tax=Streptomyces sp. NPDC048275 TaxID=3155629 RepID=UPI0033C495FD
MRAPSAYKSFLSLPDARIQRFYWIQLYKAASAARRDAPVMATSGPWLEPTPWPNTWWSLNAQLEYWLIHVSNHLELDAITWALSEFRDNLANEVAQPYRADLFPLLRKAINYYLHFIEPGPEGKLHLPATFSPEYGGSSRDCNYDLMLLTFGVPHPPRVRRTPRHQ